MDTDIHNDEIFDDYFFNWSDSNPFEVIYLKKLYSKLFCN
jgi:hypothetical protein